MKSSHRLNRRIVCPPLLGDLFLAQVAGISVKYWKETSRLLAGPVEMGRKLIDEPRRVHNFLVTRLASAN